MAAKAIPDGYHSVTPILSSKGLIARSTSIRKCSVLHSPCGWTGRTAPSGTQKLKSMVQPSCWLTSS